MLTAPSLPSRPKPPHLPITQIVIGGQILWDSERRPRRWTSENASGFERILAVHPVADASLTSTTLLTFLQQFLVFMSDMDFYHNFSADSTSATCFAKCIATAPQSLAASLERAPASGVAIQPLPPHLYSVGKAFSHNNARKMPLDTIRYGEWTLVILNDLSITDSDGSRGHKERQASSLSYCFFTATHPVVHPYMSIPVEHAIVPAQFEYHTFASFLQTIGVPAMESWSLVNFWGDHLCSRMKAAPTSRTIIASLDVCDIFGVLSDPKNYDPLLWRRMMRNQDPART